MQDSTAHPKAISILYILLSETEFVIWSVNFFPIVFSGLVWPQSNFQSGSSLVPGRRRNGLATYASCSNKAFLQNTSCRTLTPHMIKWLNERTTAVEWVWLRMTQLLLQLSCDNVMTFNWSYQLSGSRSKQFKLVKVVEPFLLLWTARYPRLQCILKPRSTRLHLPSSENTSWTITHNRVNGSIGILQGVTSWYGGTPLASCTSKALQRNNKKKSFVNSGSRITIQI